KMSQLPEAEPAPESLVYTLEELECKICYNRYDTRSRKPKLLGCLHRVCAKCLKKMVDMGESSPSVISCPFCRHETHVPDEEVRLPLLLRKRRSAAPPSCAVAASHRSSDCLVITIMELPGESPSSDSLSMLNMVGVYRPPSLDSLPCNLPNQKCRSADSPVFVWQVYFSSLPLGIYLLMIGQLWLGVVLVSLVPSTLLLCVLYGFCQCLCHEVLEAMAAHRHSLS
uniref:E3 ubiquitin-protein ligase RNF182 n=1 Tax=Myripristis murdjan TaxID=586833 RepID=A0A667YN00_9TELE